jgi:hypothetical protein
MHKGIASAYVGFIDEFEDWNFIIPFIVKKCYV